MSSSRLPGKMMRDLYGRPLLAQVIERIGAASRVSKIVVATSREESDDPIAEYCRLAGMVCARGPLEDVAGRFAQVISQESASAFIRINGDSPLMDPALIDRAVGYYDQHECDLVTNVMPRTFPKGLSVEVLLAGTFLRACETFTAPAQREHVTLGYYENPAAFRIVSFTSGEDLNALNLTVDTEDDLRRIEDVYASSQGRPGGWREIAALHRSL